MTGPTAVSPTDQAPEWDITLTDGTDSVGFVLGSPGVDADGTYRFIADPRRAQRTPTQRLALKTSQGGSKYDDQEWPYTTIPQDDWSGGRGMLNLDDDASRYYDGNRVDTSLSGKAILGPLDVTGTAAFSGGGTDIPGLFFDYKGAKYFVTQPLAGTASALYINGDRGAADSNSGLLSRLVDNSKATTWSNDDWNGAIVKIIAGPGVEEEQNWRVISDTVSNGSSSAYLTVSPAWKITHTTSTEYVILKSNTWTAISCSPLFLDMVSDVAVAGEFVYFCYEGDAVGSYVQRYQEYNSSGTWTRRADTEEASFIANRIIAISTADGKYSLWGSYNSGNRIKKTVWRADVPPQWGDLYLDKGVVFPTDRAWDTRDITNASVGYSGGNMYVSTDAAFSTGYAAVLNLDEPVDITHGEGLATTVNLGGADSDALELRFSDSEDFGRISKPTKVLGTKEFNPTQVKYWLGLFTSVASELTSAAMDAAQIHDIPVAADGSSSAVTIVDFDTINHLYIGFSTPFSAIRFEMGTPNTDAASMTVRYYDGSDWNSVNMTDGTMNGSASLGQDGTVQFTTTWRADWQPFTIGEDEAYYVDITFDANLTANITIEDIKVIPYPADIIPQVYDGYYDGTTDSPDYIALQTLGMLVGSDEPFNTVEWNVGSSVNDTTATMTAFYFNGEDWSSVAITDGTASGGKTLAQDGNMTFTIPYNWKPYTMQGTEAYWLWLKPTNNLLNASSKHRIMVYSISVTRSNIEAAKFSGIASGTQWFKYNIAPLRYPYPDYSSIKSVGIYANSDPGTATMSFYDGWHLVDNAPEYFDIPTTSNIRRLVAYGSSSGLGINPYVITEDGIFEIQQENNNAVVKLPVGEISGFASDRNGYAVCVNDVYLYLNLGRKVERYYNGNIEDIGPDLDAGLPADRQGDITSLVSYPGRVYLSIDAGSSGYSSILLRKENGWHEVYRAAVGESIYNMSYQAIPGSSTGRLWFSQSDDLKFIYVSTNPDTDTDYQYVSTGYIITGWIYAGMRTIKKVFDSVTILQNAVYALNMAYVNVAYQTDADTTSWTDVSTRFDQHQESADLASTRPAGRRIRFKITLTASSSSITPELLAFSLDLYGVVPVKYQYSWTALLTEYNGYRLNLEGNEQISLGYANVAETAQAKLDAWVDAATVLTQNSRYSLYDSKTVILNAVAHAPVEIHSELQLEEHVLNITCNDL